MNHRISNVHRRQYNVLWLMEHFLHSQWARKRRVALGEEAKRPQTQRECDSHAEAKGEVQPGDHVFEVTGIPRP